MQEKDDPTGLTTSDGTAISYGSAAGALVVAEIASHLCCQLSTILYHQPLQVP